MLASQWPLTALPQEMHRLLEMIVPFSFLVSVIASGVGSPGQTSEGGTGNKDEETKYNNHNSSRHRSIAGVGERSLWSVINFSMNFRDSPKYVPLPVSFSRTNKNYLRFYRSRKKCTIIADNHDCEGADSRTALMRNDVHFPPPTEITTVTSAK